MKKRVVAFCMGLSDLISQQMLLINAHVFPEIKQKSSSDTQNSVCKYSKSWEVIASVLLLPSLFKCFHSQYVPLRSKTKAYIIMSSQSNLYALLSPSAVVNPYCIIPTPRSFLSFVGTFFNFSSIDLLFFFSV